MIPDTAGSEQLNRFRGVGKDWLSKAENALNRAREEISKIHYSDSVTASLECIEFSIKSIFLFYGFKFPKIHKVELEINEKDKKEKSSPFKMAIDKLEVVLEQIPSPYEKEKMIKSFFYFKFWGEFYTLAKYGSIELGMGPDKLFKEKEAKLALDHAEECISLAHQIRNHLELY